MISRVFGKLCENLLCTESLPMDFISSCFSTRSEKDLFDTDCLMDFSFLFGCPLLSDPSSSLSKNLGERNDYTCSSWISGTFLACWYWSKIIFDSLRITLLKLTYIPFFILKVFFWFETWIISFSCSIISLIFWVISTWFAEPAFSEAWSMIALYFSCSFYWVEIRLLMKLIALLKICLPLTPSSDGTWIFSK